MTKSPRLALLLGLLGIGSALVYAAALGRFPLVAIYNIPLQNLDKLTGSAPGTGLILFGSVFILFIGYALGILALHRRTLDHAAWLFVLVPPVAFAGLLLFVYPTTSLDIYDYLFRGRMAMRYGANNFLAVPADFANDPLMASQPFRFIPWSRAVTAYGPLWEALSSATAWLAGERSGSTPITIDPTLLHLIIGYKALGALGFFACAGAIWFALGVLAPAQRGLGLFLWLWNPLVLWESVAAGHNDAWMALAIVLAVAAMGQGVAVDTKNERRKTKASNAALIQPIVALLALTFGGLIKYLALVFGPLMVTASLRRMANWQRVFVLMFGGLACASVIIIAYAPFWHGLATLRNFSDRGTLFYATWLAAVQAGLVEGRFVSKEVSQQLMSSIASGLLVVGVGISAWRGWRAPDHVASHSLWLLLWFLLVANPWFQPWYVLWALALVALQPQRSRMLWAVVLLSCSASVSYIAGSFLLPVLGWKGESAAWNLLLAGLIYLPPLLVLLTPRPGFSLGTRHAAAQAYK